jgi:tripartite-type tricarboxylate transporter receptor subunit TctC
MRRPLPKRRSGSSSAGTGCAIHLAMTLFGSATHTKIVHVAYNEAAPALADVRGETDTSKRHF